jgi:plastocyanin
MRQMKERAIRGSAWAALVVGCLTAGCGDRVDRAASETAEPVAATAPPGSSVVIGRAPTASGGLPPIVLLTPVEAREVPAQAAKPVMDQVSLTFTPAVMIVRTGQPAEFWNSDDVLHNIRVREEATRQGTFNVALPQGGVYEHTFEREGFYDVGCDIHPGMSAVVIATATPYTAVANEQGDFTIEGVPPGRYRATVHVGSGTIERPVDVVEGRTEVDWRGSE